MKKSIIIALCGITLTTSCTKSNNSGNTNNNNTNNSTDPNKVTVVDNGTTYTANGTYPAASNQNPVMVSILKSTSSILELQCSCADFRLAVQANGPANGIGTYEMAKGSAIIVYTQLFSGGQAYAADSGIVNIATASTTNVTGTYKIWLNGGELITGTVNANKPEIR